MSVEELLPWEIACNSLAEIEEVLNSMQMPDEQRQELLGALSILSSYFECPN